MAYKSSPKPRSLLATIFNLALSASLVASRESVSEAVGKVSLPKSSFLYPRCAARARKRALQGMKSCDLPEKGCTLMYTSSVVVDMINGDTGGTEIIGEVTGLIRKVTDVNNEEKDYQKERMRRRRICLFLLLLLFADAVDSEEIGET